MDVATGLVGVAVGMNPFVAVGVGNQAVEVGVGMTGPVIRIGRGVGVRVAVGVGVGGFHPLAVRGRYTKPTGVGDGGSIVEPMGGRKVELYTELG